MIKTSWIRKAEIRKGEETEGKEAWMPAEITGHAGFYLAEDAKGACGYAAEEHGYPLDCFYAVNLNRLLNGDFEELKTVQEEI